jgi:hypothetical protein
LFVFSAQNIIHVSRVVCYVVSISGRSVMFQKSVVFTSTATLTTNFVSTRLFHNTASSLVGYILKFGQVYGTVRWGHFGLVVSKLWWYGQLLLLLERRLHKYWCCCSICRQCRICAYRTSFSNIQSLIRPRFVVKTFLRFTSVVSDQHRDGAFTLCHCVVSNVMSTFLISHWRKICASQMPHSPALQLMTELGY